MTETFEARFRTLMEAYSLPGKRITMGAQQPLVLLKDNAGNVLIAANNLVPADGTGNFAKGCILLKTDAGADVNGFYVNVGTATSCKFIVSNTGGQIIGYTTPAAAGVACHAAVLENDGNDFPGPFTDPVLPRSLDCVFASGWQGGNVTVIGLDAFGSIVSETFVAVAGTTVAGVKIFASITSASKAAQAGTTDTCTLQTGGKIGIPAVLSDAQVLLFVNDPTDFSPVTDCPEHVDVDLTYNAFTPETPPDGAVSYKLLCNI